MKKMISVILFVGLVSTSLFGQFTTGSKSLTGVFSYNSETNDGDAVSTTMMINPGVHYYFMDNLAAIVSLNMTTYTPDGQDAQKRTTFGLGAQYHINENIYAGGTYNSDTQGDADALAHLNIRAGYLHGLSESVYLDVNGNYRMGMGDNKAGGMTLGVGIFYIF